MMGVPCFLSCLTRTSANSRTKTLLPSSVVYLRSLPPVHHELPKTEIIFPVKYLIRGVPQPLDAPLPDIPPDPSSPKYQAHMAKIAGCADCHTPMVQGDEVKGMGLAGGQLFRGPWGRVASADITPDETGVKNYTEDFFSCRCCAPASSMASR